MRLAWSPLVVEAVCSLRGRIRPKVNVCQTSDPAGLRRGQKLSQMTSQFNWSSETFLPGP